MKGLTIATLITLAIVAVVLTIAVILPPIIFRYHVYLRLNYLARYKNSTLFILAFFNNQPKRENLGNCLAGLNDCKDEVKSFFERYGIECYDINLKFFRISKGKCENSNKIPVPIAKPYNPKEKIVVSEWRLE